jgi:hypothetical protein
MRMPFGNAISENSSRERASETLGWRTLIGRGTKVKPKHLRPAHKRFGLERKSQPSFLKKRSKKLLLPSRFHDHAGTRHKSLFLIFRKQYSYALSRARDSAIAQVENP